MEGFLQSLKVEDRAEQEHICALAGGEARGRGQRHAWNTTGTLWWRGEPVDRLSAAYQALLDRAYEALFAQSRKFRDALAASGEPKLTHSIGKDDPCETILTTDELCGRLERLRARLVADAAKSPAGG
jgi:protein GP30.3